MSDVVHQRAECGFARNWDRLEAFGNRRGVDSGQYSGGDGFGITLDPRKLSGDEDTWPGAQGKALSQHRRRVDVGVAVNLTVAEKFRIFQAGNHAQNPGLLAELKVILEADEVIRVRA